mgnify:CR=1 FL=1
MTSEATERSVDIIRSGCDKLGVSEIEVSRLGADQISVGIPGATNVGTATECATTPARLYFYDWQNNLIGPAKELSLVGGNQDPEEVQKEVRDAMRSVLEEIEAGRRQVSKSDLDDEAALRMMRVCLGERVPPEYAPMALEEMAMRDRAVRWRSTPPPGAAGEGNALTLVVNAHPVPLTTEGVRAVVREPEPRRVAYAWTILPGIATQPAEVWATDIDGQRTLVERVTVRGGEILRGSWLTDSPGPVRFELFLAGVPYGEPLLVP